MVLCAFSPGEIPAVCEQLNDERGEPCKSESRSGVGLAEPRLGSSSLCYRAFFHPVALRSAELETRQDVAPHLRIPTCAAAKKENEDNAEIGADMEIWAAGCVRACIGAGRALINLIRNL